MTTRGQLEYQHLTYAMLVDPRVQWYWVYSPCGEPNKLALVLKTLVRCPGLELRETTFTNEDGDESTLYRSNILRNKSGRFLPEQWIELVWSVYPR